MKVIRQKYIVFSLKQGQSSWSFTIPPGLIECEKPNEFIRLVVRKLVFRNNIQTISAGQDKLFVDGREVLIQHGSPNVLSFVDYLNGVSQPLTWSFDPYDSRLTVKNGSQRVIELDPGTLGAIIGLDAATQLAPCSVFRMPYILDLAPAETLFLRLNSLPSTSVEVDLNGIVRNRDLLCAMGVDSAPYQTFIYRDLEAAFVQRLPGNRVNELTFTLTDSDDVGIVFETPATMIIEVQFTVDDEAEVVRLLEKSTDIAMMKLLQKNISAKT